jgi:sugar (pentulose or hexulose) kinase
MTNEKKYVIGCDVGTSGTKAVLTDRNGTVISKAYEPYGLNSLYPGWAEQDPNQWLNAVVKTVSKVATAVDKNEIACICISALYGGTGVLCDENMNSIRPAIIWMDRRAEKESDFVRNIIGEAAMLEETGNGIDSYFGYTKLLWVKNNEPDNWSKIFQILPAHSYLVYKLTGVISTDYCSAGNIGGIYDYQNHCWSKKMTKLLGIDEKLLPHYFQRPDEIAGYLNEEYAKKTGIPAGVPICVGTVDCVSSMLSASILRNGDNAAILGTSLNWGFVHSNKPDNPKLISMPYCTNPFVSSYTYGGASTAGALPRWFMTNFTAGETAEQYREMEDEIMNSGMKPGSDGLVLLPYFMGERTPVWDENASGLLLGLSLMHTKHHIFKAILESSAYALRHIMESIISEQKPDKIVLVGGGSKSKLWQHIFADVTGIPVYTTVKEVEAPLGDAFIAAKAVGMVSDFSEMENWVTFHEPLLPDQKNHELYNGYFEIYKELYPILKEKMKALKTLSR